MSDTTTFEETQLEPSSYGIVTKNTIIYFNVNVNQSRARQGIFSRRSAISTAGLQLNIPGKTATTACSYMIPGSGICVRNFSEGGAAVETWNRSEACGVER